MSNLSFTECCLTQVQDGYKSITASPTEHSTYYLNDIVQRILVAVFLTIISLLGIVGNLLVLLAVVVCRRLQTRTNVFVVNLSIADLLTSLSLPFQAAAVVTDDDGSGLFMFSNGFCALITMLQITCLGCSILTMTTIAINRFLLITRSKSACKRFFPPAVLVGVLLASWLIPAAEFGVSVVAGSITLGYYHRFRVCAWHEEFPLSKFLVGVTLILAVCVTLTCYVKTYLFVRRHARAVGNLAKASSSQHRSNASLAEQPSRSLASGATGTVLVPLSVAYNTKRNRRYHDPIVVEDTDYQDAKAVSPIPSTGSVAWTPRENDDASSLQTVRKPGDVTPTKQNAHFRANTRSLDVQITKNLFLVMCAFVVCIVPFPTCLAAVSCEEPFIYTLVALFMGSCINPIIYGFSHPHFRPVFACLVTCRLADVPQPSRLARRITNKS